MMRLISIFVRECKGRPKNAEVYIFVSREEALHWLHEKGHLVDQKAFSSQMRDHS